MNINDAASLVALAGVLFVMSCAMFYNAWRRNKRALYRYRRAEEMMNEALQYHSKISVIFKDWAADKLLEEQE